MSYKVGDEVKIRNVPYLLSKGIPFHVLDAIEEKISNERGGNRVFTIKNILPNTYYRDGMETCYQLNGIGHNWVADEFETVMKYKLDDQVVIKTWAELRAELGNQIKSSRPGLKPIEYISMEGEIDFMLRQSKMLDNLGTDRVLTINIRNGDHYLMKELGWMWTDEMIKGKVGEVEESILPEIIESIDSRFEILDL